MGKGDKRSKRGKICIGSSGKTRLKPSKTKKAVAVVAKPAVKAAPKVVAPKASPAPKAKKPAAK
jgi:ribosomal small subunit protein bTHX